MRTSKARAVVLSAPVLLLAACASETTPSAPFDGGHGAAPRDGGLHPFFDVSAPAVCHRCGDGATEASPGKSDIGVPDASRPDATARAADAAVDAARAIADAAAEARIPGAELPPAGYPAAPYGTGVGETLPYLRWQGYVADGDPDAGLVSEGAWTAYSSDDLRRSGKRIALVHVADFSCPGCNHAASILAARTPATERDGAAIVEVLGSTYFTDPADRAHLDAWVTTYELRVTSVIDAPGHELMTLNDVGIRETSLVVDLPTMRIAYRATGDLAGIGPSSLDGALEYIHGMLAD